MERKTTEDYKRQLKSLRPNLTVKGIYSTNNTKIEHLCICGHVWITTPTSLLNRKEVNFHCPKCKIPKDTKTNETYKKELEHKGCYSLEPYINAHTKILHKCKYCNSEWLAEPRSVLQNGIACTKCWETTKKSTEYYVKELECSDYRLVGIYVNARTKTQHECTKCNHVWNVKPNDILSLKAGCPNCTIRGFKSEEPATLYFCKINNNLYKLGITNRTPKERFTSDWIKFNIETIWQIDFRKGRIAYVLEQNLLKTYKHLLINTGLLISGNTETLSEEIPCPI